MAAGRQQYTDGMHGEGAELVEGEAATPRGDHDASW
jgi:hypothetical protein